MSTDMLRVGTIGAGHNALFAHVPRLRATGRVEVVAISRRNEELLALAQETLDIPQAYTDWEEMLDQAELDAVVVSTPDALHAQHAIPALEHGLHVLVEKPMALSSQDAWAMVAAAEEADRVLMVGYNARGMGSWRAAKDLLASGTIGPIRQVAVTCCIDGRLFWQHVEAAPSTLEWLESTPLRATLGRAIMWDPEHWYRDPAMCGGGRFVDVGTHVMDLALWLAGSTPNQVAAFQQACETGAESVMDVQARLVNGACLSLAFNDNVAGGEVFDFYGQGRLTVYGDRGVLTADWTGYMTTEAQEMWVEKDGLRQKVEPRAETVNPDEAFVATVLDGAPNIAPPEEAARTVALTEAAYRSAAEGRIVDAAQPPG